MKKLIPLIILLLLFTTSCSKNEEPKEIKYQTINQEEAVTKIDNGALLIDVREPIEHQLNKIEGSINIPLASINEITTKYPNKEQIIIVYCESGGRSKTAVEKLIALGYINIYDLGSIHNWK